MNPSQDNSSDVGNIVVNPYNPGAVGSVAATKQLDTLSTVYGVDFNTFSFSGGGGSYTYQLTTQSTMSTKVHFSISFKVRGARHRGPYALAMAAARARLALPCTAWVLPASLATVSVAPWNCVWVR